MEKTETVSADQLIGELPKVTPAVANAAASSEEPRTEIPASAAASAVPECDEHGVPYDEEKHLPTKHPKTGSWMPRRKSKNAAAKAEPASPGEASFIPDDPAPPPPAPPADQFEQAGAAATAALVALGCTAFGEEWVPRKGEVNTLQSAFAAYFKAKGVADIPPGLALTIAILGYAGPRFTQPKTLTRLQQFKLWFANWRARRAGHSLAGHMPHVPPAS